MQAIKQRRLVDIVWTLGLKTTSSSSNWCFNRFRLYTASTNTLVEARKADGTIIGRQLFRTAGYTWGADYEMSALFDFSFNTTNQEISIYFSGIGASTFMQLYAYTGHAGSAVRWSEDANVTQSIINAKISFIDMGFFKFNNNPVDGFVYLENQGINEIANPREFYGRVLDLRNNNISAATADELFIGCDLNAHQTSPGNLLLSGNNGRTSASDAAAISLSNKGWTNSI